MRELYCDRLADVNVASWDVRGEHGVCADCGEKVTAAPNPERRLVCVPCLTRDSPPYEPVVVHGDPHHCGDCWVAARERGWFPAEARSPRWWGT